MVRHLAEGMHSPIEPITYLTQDIKPNLTIFISQKNVLPTIAS